MKNGKLWGRLIITTVSSLPRAEAAAAPRPRAAFCLLVSDTAFEGGTCWPGRAWGRDCQAIVRDQSHEGRTGDCDHCPEVPRTQAPLRGPCPGL